MIWLNFGIWRSKSTSVFVWRRIYKNGVTWTPFVMAEIRYNRRQCVTK